MTRAVHIVHTSAGWSVITTAPPPLWFYRAIFAIHDFRVAAARRCSPLTLFQKGFR